MYTGRILPLSGDSLIYFGSNTVIIHEITNRLFGSDNGSTSYHGLGLGKNSHALGVHSTAMGYNVKTNAVAENAVVIGSGIGSGADLLVNGQSNTLMVGFNSDKPTLVVTGGNGTSGSLGNVGIGTTNPTARLHIAGAVGVDGVRFPDGSLQTTAFNANSGWSLKGNSGTNPSTDFIGTTNNTDVVFKRNTSEFMRLTTNNVFFTAPNMLAVNGHIELVDHLIFNSTTTNGVINWPAGKNFYFRTNNVSGNVLGYENKMIIMSNGHVGLGTTPHCEFHN